MRINIKGNNISSEKIAEALASCEKEYNLKITGATIYVRFENGSGQTVEPLQDGEPFSRDFWFNKQKAPILHMEQPKQPQATPAEPIPTQEMIKLCAEAARRTLASGEIARLMTLNANKDIEKAMFAECLQETIVRTGSVNVAYLVAMVKHRLSRR